MTLPDSVLVKVNWDGVVEDNMGLVTVKQLIFLIQRVEETWYKDFKFKR